MSTSESVPALFRPIRVGEVTLAHRVVLAPLTRYRANKAHVHGDLAVEYYAQRGSVPGTLLITEATFISPRAGGYANVPGLWNEHQVDAWRRVTDAVHVKGSFIFAQLWTLGRAADHAVLKAEDPSLPYVSASDIALSDHLLAPRALTIPEIKEYIEDFTNAATNAVEAGFDGVEIHSAHGYLLDQFIQDVSNHRTDEYGGSIENRCRFTLEAVAAVTKTIGQKKTGIRLSPWSIYQDMRMADPVPTFTYLVTRLRETYPDLAYIHFTEPPVSGNTDSTPGSDDSNDIFRKLAAPIVTLSTGGYKRETGIQAAEAQGGLIGFGRAFLANPDLPLRLRDNLPLNEYDRSTFYTKESPVGYIDYPFVEEVKAGTSKAAL